LNRNCVVENIQRDFRSMSSNGFRRKNALFMTSRYKYSTIAPDFLAVTFCEALVLFPQPRMVVSFVIG
jgi:hypothetical protein